MKLLAKTGFDEEAFKKYFKNTGLLMFGRVGSLAIKMVVSIFLANYLLAGKNGDLNASISYIFLFAAFAGLGLDSFIVKELHQFPQNKNKILGTAFILKVIAGAVCVPLIFGAWQFFPLKGISYQIIFILSFTGLLQSLTVIDAFFQSQVQSKYIMQVQVIGNLISAAIKIILIRNNADFIDFVYAALFDVFVLSFGYFLTYNRGDRKIFDWRFDKKLAKKLLSFSWPLIISGIMVSVYMRIDTIMLKNLLGDEGAAAGAYATVVMFSEALNFVPGAIVASLFPAILNAKRDDKQRYMKRVQNLYDLMIWLSLSFAIFISFASPLIYKLFKAQYAAAAPVLTVHVWGSLFVFLGVASTQVLIAEGYHKLTFIRTGFGAIVNVVLNIILIPKMGMMGTAIATVLAYASSTFLILFIPKTRRQGIMMLKSVFLVSIFQKIFKR